MSAGTAVILGAGLGSRLRPLTDDRPKCVVELAGEPLAVRMLRQLADRGVRRGVVVVGHFAERARQLVGGRVGGLEVDFVENAEFATTNTMYSTHLAMDALRGGGYLVEGDIACSDEAVDRLVAAPPSQGFWAASPWTPAHTGSRLRDDGTGRIVGQEIWRAATEGSTRGLWKSAGMLKLDPATAAVLADCLALEVAAGRRNVYYDDVVGRHLARFDLRVLELAPGSWVEIDDHADLADAQRLVGGRT